MDKFLNVIKIIANIVSAFMLLLVLYIVGAHFINPNESNSVQLSVVEIALSISMALMFIGVIIAFWFRLWGGILTILSYTVFAIIEGNITQGYVFYVFLIIGIVNLYLGLIKYRNNR